ncbi:TetR/AcrR family transcriptional regulator [Pseudonocardia lutea]|uniref:TetR/AcrR family transcriptional regulator n=1 Tax=Pseudonocardia lutea TaxID=2172015 RepID=A0ABW1IBF7_9PSEU
MEESSGDPASDTGPGTRRRTGVRELHRQLTRQRLLDAAVDCFTASGYVATTIEHITATAGTTRATFYRHFATKAEVVIEILRVLGEDFESAFVALAEIAEAPERGAVRQWLGATLDTWDKTRKASSAVAEAAAVEPTVQAHRSAAFERDIANLADGLQRSGRWGPDAARVRAVVLMSQLEQLFVRWSTQGWDVDRASVVEVLTAMWSAALDLPETD